jgi:hypothetical protein
MAAQASLRITFGMSEQQRLLPSLYAPLYNLVWRVRNAISPNE